MGQQMTDGDGMTLRGKIRKIRTQFIIQRDFVLLDESHECGGSELLRERADTECSLGVRAHIMLDFSQSVTPGENDFTASRDGDRESDTPRFLQCLGNKGVNLFDELLVGGRGGDGRGGKPRKGHRQGQENVQS